MCCSVRDSKKCLQVDRIAPWDVSCLTPAKLARYYRLVGGDYDALFLNTPHTSLSFIYRSLGCLHTLQPEQNPYLSPSIPALTSHGFVRWQTIQLLLDPSEHVPFLQESVKRFDLVNPAQGQAFPCILPKSALPLRPDADMTAWHATVSEKLMLEARASQERSLPRQTPMPALSDVDESSRPTSADSLSIESQSLIDAASYFQHPRTFPPRSAPRSSANLSSNSPGFPPQHPYSSSSSPLQRRSSYPGPRSASKHHAPWSGQPHHISQSRFHSRPAAHKRAPSSSSSSSCSSDCSSSSTRSASRSPVRRHAPLSAASRLRARTNSGLSMPLHRPRSHPDYSQMLDNAAGLAPTKIRNVRWHDQRPESGPSSSSSKQSQGVGQPPARNPRYHAVPSTSNRARSAGAGPANEPQKASFFRNRLKRGS